MSEFIDVLRIEAEEREAIHANHESSRPLSEDYELIGLVGEAEFSRAYHQPMDLNRRAGGDGRIDFVIPLAYTVDVKTARKAYNLIEERGKIEADIYVLAQYIEDGRKAKMLGWEWGSVLVKAPYKDFGHGIINHYIPREQLRPMSDLERRIMHLKVSI